MQFPLICILVVQPRSALHSVHLVATGKDFVPESNTALPRDARLPSSVSSAVYGQRSIETGKRRERREGDAPAEILPVGQPRARDARTLVACVSTARRPLRRPSFGKEEVIFQETSDAPHEHGALGLKPFTELRATSNQVLGRKDDRCLFYYSYPPSERICI